jgi:hypothetical protein
MSKFRCFSLGTPQIKLERHICGTTNSKPPGPINCDRPVRNTEPQSGPIYYSFLEVHSTTVLGHLPPTASCTNLVQKNQFPELNRHILTVLQNCTVWSHILSIVRDALRLYHSEAALPKQWPFAKIGTSMP